jgi:tetratricopeptide (TPR) repeat protein
VLGLTHYFSISYIFGRARRLEKREEKRIAVQLQQRASMTADVFYRQGLELQTDGAYEEALRNYDIALTWDPDHEPASKNLESLEQMMREREADKHLAQGITHFEEENYIDAIAAFGRVLEIEPTNESADNWFKTASDLLVKEHVKKMQVKRELGDKIAQYFAQGLDMYSRKKYTAAISEWEKIISIDSAHQAAHDYVRQAKLKIKEQVVELLKRADWYMSSRQWLNAAHEINRALAIEPRNDDGLAKKKMIKATLRKLSSEHAQKGIKLYGQGEYGLAETEFKMSLNYDVSNTNARDYLTRIKSKEKEISGEDISELYMNGVNAYTREDYQMAVFFWKRVLESDPHHVNALRNLERAEEKLKISTTD